MATPRFRKKADKDLVVIPGVGRVAPGQVLVGMEYKRFAVLGLLEEIPDVAQIMKPKVSPTPQVKEPSPAPKVVESPKVTKGVELPDTSDIEDPELNKGWSDEDADEDADENSEESDETDAEQEAKLKKRAEVRRKGAKKR